uniref:Interleukin 15 receptor subunit alpha n=1 Tax=Myotis myotis TaxID=51298 RepID=A0A7J8AKM4_MYOMY|nr:interleukin 15 receptor subunit alpha [Myotis myotis]
MARHPLRDCWAIELPVLLLLLLRPPQTPGTTCSTPTSIEHANIQVKSYNENSRERYICNSGFKRKAGTSSLTKCLRNEDTNITQWTIPTLICISSHSSSSTAVTVATIATPVTVLCGACVVLLLVCYHKKSRQTSQTPSDQVENMEDIPMTGGNNGREEDTENYHTV